MRCVLVGNYGAKNLGDELLRRYFVEVFPEISWVVLVAHPEEQGANARLPLGLRSFLSFRWVKTLWAMRQCDAVVFGGGSLFTDIESLRACVLWFLHAAIARVLRKPIIFAFQGIGPFRTHLGELLAKKSYAWGGFISVRDTSSFARVQAWKLNIKIVQSFDPVFSLYIKENINSRTKNVITIIPRKNSDARFLDAVSKACREHPAAPLQIALLEPEAEQGIVSRLREHCSVRSAVIPCTTLQELFQAIGGSRLLITQRYHAALAAAALGVPFLVVPQGEGDKLQSLPEGASRETLLGLVKNGEVGLREKLRVLG
jgi:polysaccharide pyruvyl transferase CsaB